MTFNRPSNRRAQGFTLMEVLIATVAFAIVLAAINGVFYGAMRLRAKTVQSIDESVPMQHALAIIKRDLANIVVPGGTFFGALQTTPTANLTAQSSSGTTASKPTSQSVLGQSSPDFFTTSGTIDETSYWADVQKVSYLLVNSTNGAAGRDLYRSVTRNLLPSLQDTPAQEPLMGGVQSIFFYYYDGSQWRQSWDSTTVDTTTGLSNSLPKAIKVQLAMAVEEKGRRQPPPIELVVPITVAGPTNQVSSP
jgi:type II secretion system protein J